MPGVDVAASAGYAPMTSVFARRRYAVGGRPLPPPGQEPYAVDTPVGPDYFRAMRIPLVAGRVFTDRDSASAQPVMVVSEEFARRTFPGEQAIAVALRPR